MVYIYKENKKSKAGIPVRLGLISGIIIAMIIVSFSVPTPRIEQTDDGKSWHVLWKGNFADLARAEGSPGAGVAGILEVFFPNATVTPNNTYAINTSSVIETWCTAAHLGYTSADDFYTELAHSTSFDLVVRVRGNMTVCGDGTNFRAEWLRVNITAAAPLTLTDHWTFGVITNNSSTTGQPYIWMNFWINGTYGTGTAFQLTKDQSCVISEIRFEAYY